MPLLYHAWSGVFLLTYYALRKMHSVSVLISLSFKQINIRLTGRPDLWIAFGFLLSTLNVFIEMCLTSGQPGNRNFLMQPAFRVKRASMHDFINSIRWEILFRALTNFISSHQTILWKWLIRTQFGRLCNATSECWNIWTSLTDEIRILRKNETRKKTGFVGT